MQQIGAADITKAVAIGTSAIAACHIDYYSLCDKNDFAALTDDYKIASIHTLLTSIEDETLRRYVIKAIQLDRESKTYADDIDRTLAILDQQAELQQKCREHIKKPEVKEAGFDARQAGLLMYFIAETNKVYFSDKAKNTNIKVCTKALHTIFGYSEESFKGKVTPDFKNEKCVQDIYYIANTIKYVMPDVYDSIMIHLESNNL